MTILIRHLAAELARSYLIVGISLLVLFDLIAFLTEAEDIGDGNYHAADALAYILLSSPARLIDLTPFVCLLSTLLALSRFNRTSELTAVRSAGVSSRQIAVATVLLALGYLVPITVLDWVARPIYQEAILDRMHATSARGNALRGGGFWTVNRNTYVHVAEFDRATQPKGIRVFEFDGNSRLRRYMTADHADVLLTDEWQLRDVTEKSIAPDGGIETSTHKERTWAPVWAASRDMYELPDDSLSLPELRERIAYQADIEQAVVNLETQLWVRITLPLSGLVFTLFAAPFAMTPNPRGGMAGQIAIGSVLAMLIYLAQQLITSAAVLIGLAPSLAVALPILLVLLAGWLMLRRTA